MGNLVRKSGKKYILDRDVKQAVKRDGELEEMMAGIKPISSRNMQNYRRSITTIGKTKAEGMRINFKSVKLMNAYINHVAVKVATYAVKLARGKANSAKDIYIAVTSKLPKGVAKRANAKGTAAVKKTGGTVG